MQKECSPAELHGRRQEQNSDKGFLNAQSKGAIASLLRLFCKLKPAACHLFIPMRFFLAPSGATKNCCTFSACRYVSTLCAWYQLSVTTMPSHRTEKLQFVHLEHDAQDLFVYDVGESLIPNLYNATCFSQLSDPECCGSSVGDCSEACLTSGGFSAGGRQGLSARRQHRAQFSGLGSFFGGTVCV